MLDGIKKFGAKVKAVAATAKDSVATIATALGDLNGDGKVDERDVQIAADWARKKASAATDEAGRLGKEAMRTDLVKDTAAGAAIGAVIAIPLPIVGPLAGAAVGAGVGAYKNFTRKGSATLAIPKVKGEDKHAALLKLSDLRDKDILSVSEFESEKQKILSGDA